jgi:general secretion pathway protein G
MRRANQGFTLIELLIVVAIIGIIAAIAIPALRLAVQRARQSRTMADMRAVATALEIYHHDNGFVPELPLAPVDGVAVFLQPTYVKRAPLLDSWQESLRYASDTVSYTLWSYGADRIEQTSPPLGLTRSFTDDIIFANGTFVQWPEGARTQ